jgi:hypothetical protein
VSHNILSQCDRALVAYLISVEAGTSDDTYPAKRAADRALPNTVCHSKSWRFLSPNSGVYVVQAQVLVHTDPNVDVDETAEDKTGASEERVTAVFDAFFTGVDSSSETLADAITQAGRDADSGLEDFTIQSCVAESGDSGHDEKRNAWMDAIDLEIVCCPAEVS